MELTVERLRGMIRDVPDFPQPGVLFKDITTLLQDPEGLRLTMSALAIPWKNQQIDRVLGMESRGFIFALPLALELGAGFVPVRKKGKLPADTIFEEYDLEYGSATLEIHRDAIQPGMKVLLVDDLLATGGTASASTRLVQRLGGEIVGLSFLVELDFLNGRKTLGDYRIESLLRY